MVFNLQFNVTLPWAGDIHRVSAGPHRHLDLLWTAPLHWRPPPTTTSSRWCVLKGLQLSTRTCSYLEWGWARGMISATCPPALCRPEPRAPLREAAEHGNAPQWEGQSWRGRDWAPGNGGPAARRRGADRRQTACKLKAPRPRHMLQRSSDLTYKTQSQRKNYLEFQDGNCRALNSKHPQDPSEPGVLSLCFVDTSMKPAVWDRIIEISEGPENSLFFITFVACIGCCRWFYFCT